MIIALESFELELNDSFSRKWLDMTAAPINPTAGRNGTGAAVLTTNSHTVRFPGSNTTRILVGCWRTTTGALVTAEFIRCSDQITLRVLSNGGIDVIREPSTVLGTSSAGLIVAGVGHTIELDVLIHGSAGTIKVKVDGITVIDETGLNTERTIGAVVDYVTFVGTNSLIVQLDDVYILNGSAPVNALLAFWEVEGLVADGDGALSDFTTLFPASPTTHYTKINELGNDGDTSYIESKTAGHVDTFTFGNLSTFVGSNVKGVQVVGVVKKDEPSVARESRLVTRPVSTNYFGSSIAVPTDEYRHIITEYELNPETAATWTESQVTASEFGVELVV